MEGIEYQLRSTQNPVRPRRLYPLSLDRRMQQADLLRQSEEELNLALQSIEESDSTPRAGNHTGDQNCERCIKKERQITEAYYRYYLGDEPGRWDYHLSAYREEVERMFNELGTCTLEDIHARYQQELREHLKNDLCKVKRGDSETVVEKKNLALSQFDLGQDLKQILEMHLDSILSSTTPEAAEAITELQKTKTYEERIPIYVKYYCTPSQTDTPQQKNIKAKYARQFKAGIPHDEVLDAWKKEVISSQKEEILKLKHRLGELQMAQSAHLKHKAKKAEKDQRMQDREYVFVPKMERCALEKCGKEVDLSVEGGALQCAVCDWLAVRNEKRRRFFYCCEEHAEEDFDEHDRNEHSCIMENHCIYHPEAGPEGETGAGGLCPDCMDEGYVSYFCSQACYARNLEAHREMFHYGREIKNASEQLDIFRPEPDLEVVASS